MDWRARIQKKIIKEVKQDKNKHESYLEIINSKIEAAKELSEKHYYSQITLLYDALRSLLEIIALQKGYKIYNHECYSAFLKEKLQFSREANKFDQLRKTRNNINYYGKEINKEEARVVIEELKELIVFCKEYLRK